MFTPSPEQTNIFDHVETSENDLIVSAVPGSGKTTTIVNGVSLLNPLSDSLFLAFGKHIADELTQKLPYYVDVSTSHSYGLSTLRSNSENRVDVDFNKFRDFIYHNGSQLKDTGRVSSYYPLSRLIDLIRLSRTNIFQSDSKSISELRHMAYTYGVSGIDCFDDVLLKFARDAITWGIDWYKTAGVVDFCDMLWLPVELDYEPTKQYEYVFVDEIQDFSNAMLDLLDTTVSDMGKLVMVGDDNQACFKFAGAGKASVDEAKRRYDPDILPLTTCYRCPESHIELANTVYPGIRHRDGAPKGELLRDDISVSQLISTAEIGDMIICRRVAPLIQTCLDFILADRPAVVKGKGVKQSLFRSFDEISAQKKFKYGKVFEFIDSWHESNVEKVSQLYEKPDNAIAELEDRYNAVVSCVNAFNVTSFRSMKKKIDNVFTDAGKDCIQLASIHSAKGLEANNVTLLEADKLPFKFPGMTDDDKDQERNLQYIAYTRSKDTLRLLSKEDD